MSVFYFYRHLYLQTCGHIFRFRLLLEDKWGLSLGELIRLFCIMLLYRYLLHYGLLFYFMSQYLWLFSLILQGLHKEGESGSWNSGLEKEQILETYSAQLQKSWNSTEHLKTNKEKSSPKMKARGPTPCSPPTSWAPWWLSNVHLLIYEVFRWEKIGRNFWDETPPPRGGTLADPI